MIRAWAGLAVLLGSAAAHAKTVSGTVFSDLDADGLLGASDAPLFGVVVFWETSVSATTDAQGRYSMDVPGPGIVWVRTPDGFRVSPVWRNATGAATETIDLPLLPSDATGDATFVHASDTHIGAVPAIDVAVALARATDIVPPPHFFVITGDVTTGADQEDFEELFFALRSVDLPFVPVPGNHDWYDGGAAYRRWLGPPTYSFDAGGAHFVVLNDRPEAIGASLAFLERDLALVPDGRPTTVFIHVPPDDDVLRSLSAAGVDFVVSGHWHSNRAFETAGLLQINTQPLAMGGIDFSPAGYRVITITPGGTLTSTHYTTVDEDYFSVVHPRPEGCVPDGALTILAAVEVGQAEAQVFASLDGAPPTPLVFQGGWTWAAEVSVGATGPHELVVELRRASRVERRRVTFCVDPSVRAPAERLPDWPQLQGGPLHRGMVAQAVAPPLDVVWARAVGGHVRGGSPVLADGRLFVSVADYAAAAEGGLVALDARTGALLWERRVGPSVLNAAAVQGDIVVFASQDGVIHALDVSDGRERWRHDLAEGLRESDSWLYASPTIADGLVYVGVNRRLAALDLATGARVWEVDPSPTAVWLASHASVTVADGVALGVFGRGADGLGAWSATTGAERWRFDGAASKGMATAPVVGDGTVYFGNSATHVFAVDLDDGAVRWSANLHDLSEWDYGLAATFALANDHLFVPTQHGSFVALDARTGAERWRAEGELAAIRPTHYRTRVEGAFGASPIVTGDVVWVGGADGRLRAFEAESGFPLGDMDLGAPILAGPVAAGTMLFVATWDGSVRALVGRPYVSLPRAPTGCGCTVGRARHGTSSASGALGFALASCLAGVALGWIRGRRDSRRPCQRGVGAHRDARRSRGRRVVPRRDVRRSRGRRVVPRRDVRRSRGRRVVPRRDVRRSRGRRVVPRRDVRRSRSAIRAVSRGRPLELGGY